MRAMWRLIAPGDVVSVWSGRREIRCEVVECDESGLRVAVADVDSPTKPGAALRSGDGVVIRMSDGRFRPATVMRSGPPTLIGPVPNADDGPGTDTCTCPGCWRPDVPALPPSPIQIDDGAVWGYECDECGHAWTNLDYERYLRWLDRPAADGRSDAAGSRPRLQAESSLP